VELGLLAALLNVAAVVGAWASRSAEPRLQEARDKLESERDEFARGLAEAAPLAATGRLVANVAHEVSNPLQAMDHIVSVLLADTPGDDDRREQLTLVKEAIERIAQYLEQLSDFYRPDDSGGLADVNGVVSDVCRFLATQLRNENVKLREELSADLPAAAIGEDTLRQAVLNVVLNAVEAMPQGGDLSVSTGLDGRNLAIIFEDTGPGIPREHLERVAEPFFTTKSGRGGTGLGLSISRRALRRHGGDLVAQISARGGTRVTLLLPPGAR
jgi:two-component system NtrC family sensor kinase